MRTIGDYHRAVIQAATSVRLKRRLKRSDLAGVTELIAQGAHLPDTDPAFARLVEALEAVVRATEAELGIRSIEIGVPAAADEALGEALIAYCQNATDQRPRSS